MPKINFLAKKFTKNTSKALVVFMLSLITTIAASIYTLHNVKVEENKKLELACAEIKTKIYSRLSAHAQLLRSGAALFASSDSVSRNEWKLFNERERIYKNLPGIQGVGYSLIIPKNLLKKHIQNIRNEGFHDYKIMPEGDREIYTSIIYLEPFMGRNLKAFGYDMFSEPKRRKAMEISRDSDIAMLSEKVILVQENKVAIQSGTLMYVPVYKNWMPINTVEERRKAIKGWVYSPYRMTDLMNKIVSFSDLNLENQIVLKIYDNNSISEESMLYNSQDGKNTKKIELPNLTFITPVNFNSKLWTLKFEQYNQNISFTHGKVIIVFVSGLIISILLFVLVLELLKSQTREKHILELNFKLEKLIRDKDHFISILAHDLKNPFNVVLGFLSLLSKNIHIYPIEKIEKHVNTINNSAKNIYNLLDGILIWISTQSGKMPFNPQKISFNEICQEVIENAKTISDSKNISVTYITSEDITLVADYNMLKTILRNLLSNAIKFTDLGGTIRIYHEKMDSEILIHVLDNGVGILAEKLNELFSFKAVNSLPGTENEKGTGIGLLLCKDFVERHGGKIWAKSKIGEGSDFHFTIPVRLNESKNIE